MTDTPDSLPGQARDIVTFGHEIGRIMSNSTVVGRTETFAKVFASSRAVKRKLGVTAWAILEDIALDAHLDIEGRLVTTHLRRLLDHGFVLHEEVRQDHTGRWTTSRNVLDPGARIERFTHNHLEPHNFRRARLTPAQRGRPSKFQSLDLHQAKIRDWFDNETSDPYVRVAAEALIRVGTWLLISIGWMRAKPVVARLH